MSDSSQVWIWRYLDGQLPPSEQVRFEDWLRESRDHRDEFARAAMLHDRMRGLLGDCSEAPLVPERERQGEVGPRLRLKLAGNWLATLASLAAAFILGAMLWQVFGGSEVRAASAELQRLNEWSRRLESRSFRIRVLDERPEPSKGRRARGRSESETAAPPKPSLEGALLHARGDDQFVLERQVPGEGVFLTGSDGKLGWAVAPDGSVRTSTDLERFKRDVPGHEHQLPLNSLFSSLERFEAAYRIQMFSAVEQVEAGDPETKSLLVAIKKRGQRGPERIEVTYESRNGRILGMRIVEMPYGPRRLDLELNLEAEGTLEPEFFRFDTHSGTNRPIVNEDQSR